MSSIMNSVRKFAATAALAVVIVTSLAATALSDPPLVSGPRLPPPKFAVPDSSGTRTFSDGTIMYSNGTVVYPDGTIWVPTVLSNGTLQYPDGTLLYTDGTVVYPDGTIVPGEGA
jgi:hypothetical protein